MCKCRGRQDAGSDRHYYFPVRHGTSTSCTSQHNVSLDNLEKLAHAFQIKVADLLASGLDWRL